MRPFSTAKAASPAVLLLAILALLLAACGGPTPTAAPTEAPAVQPTAEPTAEPAGPQSGGTLVVAISSEPATLDAADTDSADTGRIVISMTDTLVAWGDKFGEVDKSRGLATDWTISDDGLTYTFTLREGVTFHDGTPFNAEAVKFNLERQVFPDHPFHDTGSWPMGWMLGPIAEVNVIDDYTAEVVLSERYATFISALGGQAGYIVSPTAVMEHGADYGRNPVGTGPFRFVSWEPGVGVTVERYPDYWGGDVYLDQVVFRPVLEEQTRLTELQTGNVNLVYDLAGDAAALARNDANLQYQEVVGGHLWWIYLNNRTGPFSDVRVRQAANYAVNREEICHDLLADSCVPVDTYLPPSLTWSFTDDVQHYPYDPEKARELMAEAGYADGADVIFWVPLSGSGMQSPVTMAEAIQADLAEIGLNVEIQTFEWGTFLDEAPHGFGPERGRPPGDMLAISLFFDNSDPDLHFTWGFDSAHIPSEETVSWNVSYYSNPRVDELLQQGRTTLDEAGRAEAYFEIQRIVSEEAPWIPVDSQKGNVATTANVRDLVMQSNGIVRFAKVWIEQ